MSEPVDELTHTAGSGLLRAVQAANTAVTLWQSLTADARAAYAAQNKVFLDTIEAQQRILNRENQDERAAEKHQEEMKALENREARYSQLHDAQMKVQDARLQAVQEEIETTLADRERRTADSEKRNERADKETAARIDEITARKKRADQLLGAQTAEIGQRMAIRARAAGLGEQLGKQERDYDAAMNSAAAFAAAHSTANLGPQQGANMADFADRLREDTGISADQVAAAAANTERAQEPMSYLEYLATRYTMDTITRHFEGQDAPSEETSPEEGPRIEETIEATGAHYDHLGQTEASAGTDVTDGTADLDVGL